MVSSSLKDAIYSGRRITRDEALDLFSWDLLDLAHAAEARRAIIHPDATVGFIIDRIINYTNICEAECRFCAYHARAGTIEPYELSLDQILERVKDCVAAGGTQVMLQGGLHPEFNLERACAMIAAVRQQFPGIYLHSLSPAEVVHLSRRAGLGLSDTLARLKNAGLNSVPGASDLLVDRIRRTVCAKKIMTGDWIAVMRALSANGMGSSATMTYGMGETLEERIEHFDVVRTVQDETGIIRAFIPWSFSPHRTDMPDIVPATGFDYLRIVAIARIYIDNVRYIQAGWLTEGLKLAQLALAMGANDMGGVLMEEVVVKATGVTTRTNQDELVAVITNAGRVPVQRDSEYRELRRFA